MLKLVKKLVFNRKTKYYDAVKDRKKHKILMNLNGEEDLIPT